MNHRWDKNNKCINCGIHRVKRTWKRRMAIVGSKDYYQYGWSWYYGEQLADCEIAIKGLGFERPECKK